MALESLSAEPDRVDEPHAADRYSEVLSQGASRVVVSSARHCPGGFAILIEFGATHLLQKGTTMPAVVKIKPGKYGIAIGLLLERGGTFQTRHERTLIVNATQKKALEDAELIETNGAKQGPGKVHAAKKNAG
jgi:hypothetical protein